MTNKNFAEIPIYEIRIKNHLKGGWQGRFEGMSIINLDNGEAVLFGPVVDQSALHGLLEKVRQLNLILISVRRIDPS